MNTTATNFETKVFATLVKIAGTEKATVLMSLNFELFATRFGYTQPIKCAKEIYRYGDHVQPTELERWHM